MKQEQNEKRNETVGTLRVRDFIRGLSTEEKQIAVDTLPIELIYNRIGRELQEKRLLETAIKQIQIDYVRKEDQNNG